MILLKIFINFKNFIEILENNLENNIENLIKIFGICFIKIYLTKFIHKIKENTNIFEGDEYKIINEIKCARYLSDTLKLYIIILLNKNNLLLNNLSKNFEEIVQFSTKLQNELEENEYNEILNSGKIPNKEKYKYNKYFAFIKYPSFKDFEENFKNKENCPLINQYINNKEAINLKNLIDYINFTNIMINHYSGIISRAEADRENMPLYEEEIYKNNKKFHEIFDKFKEIYNNINIDKKDGKKINERQKLNYFFNDKFNENGKKIEEDLKIFAKFQNSFLNPIIEVYEKKKNSIFNYYTTQLKQKVDIQKVRSSQILQLENCFKKSNFLCFNELIYIYYERNKDNMNEFTFNYEKIEEELAQILLPNICLLNDEKMKYIIYKNEGYRLEENNPLTLYEKIYGKEELENEEKKKIFNYIKDKDNYKYYDDFLGDSFILLFNYLNTYPQDKNTTINELINDENREEKIYIRFYKKLCLYFKEEGKEITTGKLLNSFLYMEKLCFGLLLREDKISKEFSEINEEYKKKITDYFKDEYKDENIDEIITKNELATLLRKFIIRYLSAIKNNNLNNLSLFEFLNTEDLCNNKNLKKFQKKIEDYIGRNNFILECRHAYEFYKIIGKEDEENIIKEISEFEKFEISVKEEQNKNVDDYSNHQLENEYEISVEKEQNENDDDLSNLEF